MRNIILAAVAALVVIFLFNTEASFACGNTAANACGRTAPEKHFSGNKKLLNPIRVKVCHPYWNLLNIGTLNGRRTKWWGPTIRFGEWAADLPAAASQCKNWWVVPGTSIDTYATCVRREIGTGPMRRAGTYWLN